MALLSGSRGSTVADQLIRCPVKLVRARLKSEAGDSLTCPPEFCRRIECNDFEFPYSVLREWDVAKVSRPFGGAADECPVELELVAGALAPVDGHIQHAG